MEDRYFKESQKLLESIRGAPLNEQERELKAIDLAALMLRSALKNQTRKEKQEQAELARMMSDPRGKAFTMSMTDQCFRSQKTKRIADQLLYLLRHFGLPRYLNPLKRLQLYLFKKLGSSLHFLLVPLATRALRSATSKVILPGERRALSHHMKLRRKQGVRLNLNHLGEAILGEEEALRRLNIYLNDLEQEDVEYVSIKISTIFSQINVLDWRATVEVLADRLRQLYRKAMAHTFKRADGSEVVKFVNLDMEEYRDLHLTKELFKRVLNEPEFVHFSGGIVLQAYIPDSFPIQQELTKWAMERLKHGGAPVKIRIVKGANLAMEQVEASLYGWEQTPYCTKSETDANYKRMVVYGCEPTHAKAVHLGIASHNLFDIAYALLLRTEKNLDQEISFEMLEGMADHIRRTVQSLSQDMLLYCPVATKKDFQSAIAYLIRRLDENTGPENFLRHSFGLRPGTRDWDDQVALFKKACAEMDHTSQVPRRKQDRRKSPEHLPFNARFKQDPDTDFSLSHNREWMKQIVDEWKEKTFETIPLVIGGRCFDQTEEQGEGIDPSHPQGVLYRYALANWEMIDEALNCAQKQHSSWTTKSAKERAELIAKVAQKMGEKRGQLIGVMMRDGGKTFIEAEPEVSEAIDFAEYYLRSLLQYDQMKELEFTSRGTILITPPWNFPISIPAGGIAGALVTGNCVLFKPAPEAVLSGWILVNLFWEAGIPKEVLQFINCQDEPIGSQLVQDERVNAIILTGGTPTARLFMKMRPSLYLAAETGGKNALIITALADRDLAIKDLVQSAFGHSGQKCSAASLAILEAELYDNKEFLRQLKEAVESLHVGSCWDLSSKVIPLIRPPSHDLEKGLTSLEKGESWLVKPKPDPQNPHLWSPGVKLGVKEGSFMHQTELFGPVLAIMRAKDLNEALRFANGTAYGLTSGIHSLDSRETRQWLEQIEAGNCYINRGITGAIVERQPFGGCKASSFGHGSKAGGPNYLAQFMHVKQRSLPSEKESVSNIVNALTRFLEKLPLSAEELGTWFGSIANYAFWARQFSRDSDPSKLVGQDNLLRYRPRKNMAFRMQKKDAPIDLFRILAAAGSCNTPLEVSYEASGNPLDINSSWQEALPLFNFKAESEEAFNKRISSNAFERIRFASAPSDATRKAAATAGCYLGTEPVLASGRLELLNYLREMAISINYHRYGNLGVREGEERTPVL